METEQPTIEFDQAKAILRVAYLLAALDGNICEKEQAEFRELMKRLFGEQYTDVGVITYLEEILDEAKKLIELRAFYPDESELVGVFVAKVKPLLKEIANDVSVVRRAFAIWICICCADDDYSEIERAAMKQLQMLASSNSLFESFGGNGGSTFISGVSDDFLLDVEKRIKTMRTLYEKSIKADNPYAKQNYKDQYDFEVEELDEFVKESK